MIGRLGRALTVIVVGALFFVGVPILLSRAAGWPLPTKMPNWDNVYWAARQGDIPAEFVMKFFACIGWFAWAQLTWATIWEFAVNVPRAERGRRTISAPFTLRPFSVLAGRGVAVALALWSSTSAVTVAAPSLADFGSASVATMVAPPDVGSDNASVAGLESTPDIARAERSDVASRSGGRWVVATGDTLWDIAEQCLGDGARVDDLVVCNPGLDLSRRLTAGQVITLPEGVASPPDRVGTEHADGTAGVDVARAAPDIINFDINRAIITLDEHAEHAEPAVEVSVESTSTHLARDDQAASMVHVVVTGESVFAIAEQLVGDDDETMLYRTAREIIETNLGRTMADGSVFNDPSLIQPGWELIVPAASTTSAADSVDNGIDQERHEVIEGETLWSIAADELGDPTRWEELFDQNQGRTFDDGADLVDPDLIRPGWDLEIPNDANPAAPPADSPIAPPAEPEPDGTEVDAEAAVEAAEVAAEVAAEITPAAPVPIPDIVPFDPLDTVIPGSGGELAPPRPDETPLIAAPAIPGHGADGSDAWSAPTPTGEQATFDATEEEVDDDEPVKIVTLGRASMLAGGLLTLLAVRRRRRLREARPSAHGFGIPAPTAPTERELRRIAAPERFVRVELAARAAAKQLVGSGARVIAMVAADDGSVEMYPTADEITPDAPWIAAGRCWELPGSVPLDVLAEAGRRVGAPSPLLIQLGVDELGREVFVDLEALGAVEIGGPIDQADAVANAVAMSLAASVLAEVVTLVGVRMPTAAFLNHRYVQTSDDFGDALEVAATIASGFDDLEASTFDLRARATSGEAWEPAAVVVGSSAGEIEWRETKGVALVSAAPICGPSSRLAPDDGDWVLRPLGLHLTPIGLEPADVDAVDALMSGVSELGNTENTVVSMSSRRPMVQPTDETITNPLVGSGDVDDSVDANTPVDTIVERSLQASHEPPPSWDLMVRLMGPVNVVSASGEPVSFERAKARELVAWLATHRDHPSRRGARASLWDTDVRDSTFANVVSDARRAMNKMVELTDGEWIGRTNTDQLPLHQRVVTDAELIEYAIRAADRLPAGAAIEMLRPAVERIVRLPFDGSGYLWPDAEGLTSNLVLLAVSTTGALASRYLDLGDIDGVFWATARGLRVVPGHEELVGLRMQAYARRGDRAGVRAEWESYERVIAADAWSDGEPSPKLVRLRTELLRAS